MTASLALRRLLLAGAAGALVLATQCPACESEKWMCCRVGDVSYWIEEDACVGLKGTPVAHSFCKREAGPPQHCDADASCGAPRADRALSDGRRRDSIADGRRRDTTAADNGGTAGDKGSKLWDGFDPPPVCCPQGSKVHHWRLSYSMGTCGVAFDNGSPVPTGSYTTGVGGAQCYVGGPNPYITQTATVTASGSDMIAQAAHGCRENGGGCIICGSVTTAMGCGKTGSGCPSGTPVMMKLGPCGWGLVGTACGGYGVSLSPICK
jgi:hypothetical protein